MVVGGGLTVKSGERLLVRRSAHFLHIDIVPLRKGLGLLNSCFTGMGCFDL